MSSSDIKPTSAAYEAVDAQTNVVTSEDVGRELKRLRRSIGETQAESAGAIRVSRANLAQWESGKYLPSSHNARLLDDHLNARNALFRMVEAARSPRTSGTPAVTSANSFATPRSLAHVFQQVGAGLVDRLIRDNEGRALGWRHNLQMDRDRAALSTAYGIKAMLIVGEPYVDFDALTASLLGMQSQTGGWVGRSGTHRPEITATVLDALFRVGTSMTVDRALELAELSLDEFTLTRPYLLATVLQTVARLRPDAPLTKRLTDSLLAARLDFDGSSLWPEKKERGLALPEPSVVHTARAVVALQDILRHEDRSDLRDAVDQGTQWLIGRTHPDDGVTEELTRDRSDGDGTTRIMIRHFTAAWVVQALSAGPHIAVGRLHAALHTVWSRYDAELGLWAWGNGDLPIWMTLDAVTALRASSLALAMSPLSPP